MTPSPTVPDLAYLHRIRYEGTITEPFDDPTDNFRRTRAAGWVRTLPFRRPYTMTVALTEAGRAVLDAHDRESPARPVDLPRNVKPGRIYAVDDSATTAYGAQPNNAPPRRAPAYLTANDLDRFVLSVVFDDLAPAAERFSLLDPGELDTFAAWLDTLRECVGAARALTDNDETAEAA